MLKYILGGLGVAAVGYGGWKLHQRAKKNERTMWAEAKDLCQKAKDKADPMSFIKKAMETAPEGPAIPEGSKVPEGNPA